MSITTTLRIGARTDVGQIRDHNEDNFVVCKDVKEKIWNDIKPDNFKLGELGSLLMVADGMGGAEAGEEASRIAIETVQNEFSKLDSIPKSDNAIYSFLKNTIVNAHKAIVAEATRNPDWYGMGTTAIIAWVIGNKAYLCWSGDSRCYKYNENGLELLMDEHSYVWQTFVKKGKLTPEEARLHPESNLITQNLGDARNTPKPDAKKITFKKGDRILLCSDGLNGMISDDEIEAIISKGEDLPSTCKELIDAANNAGGDDNITLVLMDVTDLVGVPPGAEEEDSKIKIKRIKEKSMAPKALLFTGLLLASIGIGLWLGLRGGGEAEETNKTEPVDTLAIDNDPVTDAAKAEEDARQAAAKAEEEEEARAKEEADAKARLAANTNEDTSRKANLEKKKAAGREVNSILNGLLNSIKQSKADVEAGTLVYTDEVALVNTETAIKQLKEEYDEWDRTTTKSLNKIKDILNRAKALQAKYSRSNFFESPRSSGNIELPDKSTQEEVNDPTPSTPPVDDVARTSSTTTGEASSENDPTSGELVDRLLGKPIDEAKQKILKKDFQDLLNLKFKFGSDEHYLSIKKGDDLEWRNKDQAGNPKEVLDGFDEKLKEMATFAKANVTLEEGRVSELKNLSKLTSKKATELKSKIDSYKKNLDAMTKLVKQIKIKE